MSSSKSMDAESILAQCIADWGDERDSFPVEFGEMVFLVRDGGIHKTIDHDNTDGTFLNEVQYGGKLFMCSSTNKFSDAAT